LSPHRSAQLRSLFNILNQRRAEGGAHTFSTNLSSFSLVGSFSPPQPTPRFLFLFCKAVVWASSRNLPGLFLRTRCPSSYQVFILVAGGIGDPPISIHPYWNRATRILPSPCFSVPGMWFTPFFSILTILSGYFFLFFSPARALGIEFRLRDRYCFVVL